MKLLRNCCAFLAVSFFALAASSAFAEHHLEIGDKAPRVGSRNQDGQRWSVSRSFGKRLLLIYFYSGDNLPGSIKEACAYRDRLSEFKAQGVDVVGISFDSVDNQKKMAFNYDINFPLIADKDGHVADAYGVRLAKHDKIDRNVSFLIGLDGKIAYITSWPDPLVQLEQMRLAVKTLNTKT